MKYLLLLLTILNANAVTRYIDFDTGSDLNLGQTKELPWKRHPYMIGFTGSYAHTPGDVYVFKGGVVWPKACFPLRLSGKSGTGPTVQTTFTVDKTWFVGTGFVKPLFNMERTILGTGGLASSGIYFDNTSWVVLDNLAISNHRATYTYGSTTVAIAGNSSHLTFSNCTIRDWDTVGIGQGTDAGGGIQNYGTGTDFTITGCVLHQDNTSNKCGYAAKNVTFVNRSEFRNTPNAIFGTAISHHNVVHDIVTASDPSSHPNAIATTGPSTNYNNLIYNLAPGASALFVSPDWSGGANVDLVYNNIIYNCGLQEPLQLDTGGKPQNCGVRAYNNIFEHGTRACVRVVERNVGPYAVLDLRNNLFITTGNPILMAPSSGGAAVTTLTLQNNITNTPTQATALGYTAVNNYATPSATSQTVGKGQTIALFNTDYQDTKRDVPWDVGAYEWTGGTPPVVLLQAFNLTSVVSPLCNVEFDERLKNERPRIPPDPAPDF